MGRGRAKAKQTKVARRLKYYSPDTDLTALELELKGSESDVGSSYSPPAPEQDQEQYIAEHYGRNRHRDTAHDDLSPGDGDHASEAEETGQEPNGDAHGPASQPITPGSWMKKRA